ncbi:efflux RND transporter periplasmic adaptor subunit [Magnetospira sp. QH-2]|uniref:efflux RND transporter periplasmic adaptor subunit n=1 Tax=Magnetospira sp. (strain QH-2) TaxID=1288970 RepID=UPI0003E81119|nr:efflux RND transporter periplasmic adaptor subunit [Magnetospira sp. QH-2]CCQ75190.1 putative efflux transporter, RND family, MFP subunit [Magnetospira sp. QH-2]
MLKNNVIFSSLGGVFALALGLMGAEMGASAGEFTVKKQMIEDRKAVFATVESADLLLARARIGGTLAALSVDEGSMVEADQEIAVVGDAKLALQIQAIQAKVQSLVAERKKADTDLNRARELKRSGTIAQAKLDAAETALRVVDRNLASLQAERQVIEQQAREGAVLAPGSGRVLEVKATTGAVVLPGEVIATIAAEAYFLRMSLPERHARFLKEGDMVLVGPRGVQAASNEHLRQGQVVQVYPRMEQGRVVADVEADGLEGYLVGERTLVYVETGAREVFVVPEAALHDRFGLTFVTLTDGTEVVVERGRPVTGGIEILSGLRDGDVVKLP